MRGCGWRGGGGIRVHRHHHGAIVQIPPPPSVWIHVLESNTEMFTFDEQQNVTLAAPLGVDITVPGTYDEVADLTPGMIPAGTVVSSHFLHADKIGSGSGPVHLKGTIEVDTDILGIAVMAPNLDGSDFLGVPGTIYPTGGLQRQVGLNPTGDYIIEHVDRRTVTVKISVNAHMDQVRIITEGDPPPTGGQGCTPGYWKQELHFDSWVGYTPNQSFEAVFGRDAHSGDPSLADGAGFRGAGVNAFGRHATAALLNAASPDVSYPYTTAQVIAMYQAAFDGGAAAIEATKNDFEAANEAGCPLNYSQDGVAESGRRRPPAL